MKKAYFAILLVVVCVLAVFSGCSSKSEEFLPYQNGLFEATATLEVNSKKYSVDINKTDDNVYRLSFLSPDSLKGVCIDKNKNDLIYSVGGVHVPIRAGSNLAAESFGLLSLSKEDLISAESALLNGVKVEVKKFKNDENSVILFLSDETKMPLRIEANIGGNDITLSFSRFEVK